MYEAGWRPAYTNEQVLGELLAQVVEASTRWPGVELGGKEAATSLGAAGATVALIGTAALVRRARKSRRI